jgi:hypothetical protein
MVHNISHDVHVPFGLRGFASNGMLVQVLQLVLDVFESSGIRLAWAVVRGNKLQYALK